MERMTLDEALNIIKTNNLKTVKADDQPVDFAFPKFEVQYANDLSTKEKQLEFYNAFYARNGGVNSEAVWRDRTFNYNGDTFRVVLKTNLIKFRFTKGVITFEVLIKGARKYNNAEWFEIVKAFNDSEVYDDILNSLEEETPLRIVKSTLRRSDLWN